ncbi:MAG TPA: UTP--glucose-1-phosphate uridylyltransferase [Vicinamibacterales bacterium]|jgi:UTP--glucose-1-phosphate uridylyltransferase|nr:UTP--glucose-1-phosphate uridylyltransferase [Vicinamibacterales bacterium]
MDAIDVAVIPVAGLGTRLLPATKSQPKEMLPVGRKPVVQYVVEELTRVGITRVLFVTGPGKASIENHFDRNAELVQMLRETGKEELLAALEFDRSTVRYFYTRQRELLGLGHAVSCARSFAANQPFVVALGDSIIGMHAESDVVQRMTRCYHEREAAAVIAFEEVPNDEVSQYGIAKPKTDDELFEIEDLVEKPSPRDAPSNLAIAARYVLSPAIFDALAQTRRGKGGEIQLTDAIRAVIRNGGRAYGVRLRADERRYDIGNFEAYFEAFVEFALADPTHGPAVRRHLLKALDVSHS